MLLIKRYQIRAKANVSKFVSVCCAATQSQREDRYKKYSSFNSRILALLNKNFLNAVFQKSHDILGIESKKVVISLDLG